MNASGARRRWMKWCRYVQKTGTSANSHRQWGWTTHNGQAKAYQDYTFAKRAYPRGARAVHMPHWGVK